MTERFRRMLGEVARRESTLGWVGFYVLALIAGVWIFHSGRDLTFYYDEWEFLLHRSATGDGFLAPHNGHIAVGLMAFYQSLLHMVGMADYAVYRSILIVAHLLVAALVYVFAKRRVGPVTALAPAAVVLFLGKGALDYLWVFQIGFVVSIVTGLAALLSVERQSFKARAVVAGLLTLSVSFSEIGLSFVVAIAVILFMDSRRNRDIWVVLIPSVLYGLWFLRYDLGHNGVTFATLMRAPQFVADEIAAAAGGVFGVDNQWSRVIAGIIAVFVVKTLATTPSDRNRTLWSLLAASGLFWILVSLKRAGELGGDPYASRYLYVGSVFVALIVIELIKGRRFSTGQNAIVGLAVIAIVLANIAVHYTMRDVMVNNTTYLRAELGAIEIAQTSIESDYVLKDSLHNVLAMKAGEYLRAERKYGSPAYTAAEIASSAEPVRLAADRVLVRAASLRVELRKATLSDEGRCKRVATNGSNHAYVTDLPAGGLAIGASSIQARVAVRRFAQTSSIYVGTLQANEGLRINAAPDEAKPPWRIVIKSKGVVTLCSSGV